MQLLTLHMALAAYGWSQGVPPITFSSRFVVEEVLPNFITHMIKVCVCMLADVDVLKDQMNTSSASF